MSESMFYFTDNAISLVEKLRSGDDIPDELVKNLYKQMEEIDKKYKNQKYIPKSLAFDLLSLHDALEGALNYYSTSKKDYISELNSNINIHIESILLT